MERITIDLTVARDFLGTRRKRHGDAVALFELARGGVIEIAVAASGFLFDVKDDLEAQLRAALDQEAVSVIPQLPYPSERLYPSETFYPGRGVEGFHEAWNTILADWHGREKPGRADALHIESHLGAGRDVFITDDLPLVTMCHRLRDECGFPLDGMTLSDFLALRTAQLPADS